MFGLAVPVFQNSFTLLRPLMADVAKHDDATGFLARFIVRESAAAFGFRRRKALLAEFTSAK